MRTFLHRVAAVAAVSLAFVAVVPGPAQAAPPLVVTVDDAINFEGVVICADGTPAPPCGTIQPNSQRFYVRLSRSANQAVTVGWQLVPGTATAGSDYSGPTTGSVTIPKGSFATSFTVPLVYDGFNEPTEQFTVRLTSSSVPATITDTGTGTIQDGTQSPADCTPSVIHEGAVGLSCTNRPPGQQWQLRMLCILFWPTFVYGNVVTGNGQSIVDCGAPMGSPHFQVL